jgi:hypothetical protein
MNKLVIPIRHDDLSSTDTTLNTAKSVSDNTTLFLNGLDLYTSEELSVVEMSLSLGFVFKIVKLEDYNLLLSAIAHERNVVRGEDR